MINKFAKHDQGYSTRAMRIYVPWKPTRSWVAPTDMGLRYQRYLMGKLKADKYTEGVIS